MVPSITTSVALRCHSTLSTTKGTWSSGQQFSVARHKVVLQTLLDISTDTRMLLLLVLQQLLLQSRNCRLYALQGPWAAGQSWQSVHAGCKRCLEQGCAPRQRGVGRAVLDPGTGGRWLHLARPASRVDGSETSRTSLVPAVEHSKHTYPKTVSTCQSSQEDGINRGTGMLLITSSVLAKSSSCCNTSMSQRGSSKLHAVLLA
jgi:hypothetical protein